MESLHVFPSNILVILEEHPCLHQEIVEVHSISLTTSLNVSYINVLHLRSLLLGIVCRRRTRCVDLWQEQMVLCHRDTVGNGCWLIHLIVELHLLDDSLHQ